MCMFASFCLFMKFGNPPKREGVKGRGGGGVVTLIFHVFLDLTYVLLSKVTKALTHSK